MAVLHVGLPWALPNCEKDYHQGENSYDVFMKYKMHSNIDLSEHCI